MLGVPLRDANKKAFTKMGIAKDARFAVGLQNEMGFTSYVNFS